MRKLYSLLSMFLLCMLSAQAQFTTVGSATPAPGSNNATCFTLTPPVSQQKGAIWNNTPINLSQSFEFNTSIFFGGNDGGADGVAFVLQNEGTSYIGNEGAGLGYHRFTYDVPGPKPSFIVEFDTYTNGFVIFDNIGDPPADHVGFQSNSNAYHTSSDALAPPVPFGVNIEDNQFHDVKFTWNATTKTMTVVVTITTSPLTTQTFTYTGDIVNTIFGGNPIVYWGFTGSTGNAGGSTAIPNEQKVCIKPQAPPFTVTCVSTPANCYNKGSIDVTVTGGTAPYTYLWTNGATSQDLNNVPPGTYTVTVRDAAGQVRTSTCTIAPANNVPPVLVCPQNVVKCYTTQCYYDIPDLVATDNCGILLIKYVITGATYRLGLGRDASGSFNPGVSTITWYVLDTHGNISTCTTTVTVKKVSVTVPNAYTGTQGCKPFTIYKCYGAQSLTLQANPSGGSAPYTYLWSNGSTASSITVSPSTAGYHTYWVRVTDASGCQATKTIKVKVVGCNDNGKVVLCHVPPGNHSNRHEISVSPNAVPAHLAHGDYLGQCQDGDDDDDRGNGHHGDDDDDDGRGYHRSEPGAASTTTVKPGMETPVALQQDQDFLVVPNPTNGQFELRLNTVTGSTAQVVITDASGSVVETRTIQLNAKGGAVRFDLRRHTGGVYFVKLVTKDGVQVRKVVVQK